jgi:hypothetical protein
MEQMLRHLLLQLLATADTLYYRISTGIQALVLAVHKTFHGDIISIEQLRVQPEYSNFSSLKSMLLNCFVCAGILAVYLLAVWGISAINFRMRGSSAHTSLWARTLENRSWLHLADPFAVAGMHVP